MKKLIMILCLPAFLLPLSCSTTEEPKEETPIDTASCGVRISAKADRLRKYTKFTAMNSVNGVRKITVLCSYMYRGRRRNEKHKVFTLSPKQSKEVYRMDTQQRPSCKLTKCR